MIGVVLAGGASARFGGRAKGLMLLKGRPMAWHVADLLSGFCTSVATEAAPGAGYEALGLPLVHADMRHAGKGPLAGLAAGLSLSAEDRYVAFAPCDMPLLSRAIYDALAAAAKNSVGAYAQTPNGTEPLVAVLSARARPHLLEALDDAPPRAHVALDRAGARAVQFSDARPFANVNTPDDLARLERASN